MPLTRRTFLQGLASSLATLPTLTHADENEPPHQHADMERWNKKDGEEIAMLLYPRFTALDLTGPQYMFSCMMGAKVHLVTKDPSLKPVLSDTGMAIQPTATFATCPQKLTLLFVPGGTNGTLAAMRDAETIAFLKDRGERADYVTSVCTGSLLLGAAGLLDGYEATSHWLTRDLLPLFGAKPIAQRVVKDRNRITGGGVTAGIDFGLTLIEILRDREYAETVQLLAEYDPHPPMDLGSPEKARPETKQVLAEMLAPFLNEARNMARSPQSRSK